MLQFGLRHNGRRVLMSIYLVRSVPHRSIPLDLSPRKTWCFCDKAGPLNEQRQWSATGGLPIVHKSPARIRGKRIASVFEHTRGRHHVCPSKRSRSIVVQ